MKVAKTLGATRVNAETLGEFGYKVFTRIDNSSAVWALVPVSSEERWLAPKRRIQKLSCNEALVVHGITGVTLRLAILSCVRTAERHQRGVTANARFSRRLTLDEF